jgi:DNA-binding HxlR family transcriptional regulator
MTKLPPAPNLDQAAVEGRASSRTAFGTRRRDLFGNSSLDRPINIPMRGKRFDRDARSSANAEPVATLFDLLERRWALRILWELRVGLLTFRAIQERCDNASPSVINTRIRELADADLVDISDGEGYLLTGWGHDIVAQFVPLSRWSREWALPRH